MQIAVRGTWNQHWGALHVVVRKGSSCASELTMVWQAPTQAPMPSPYPRITSATWLTASTLGTGDVNAPPKRGPHELDVLAFDDGARRVTGPIIARIAGPLE